MRMRLVGRKGMTMAERTPDRNEDLRDVFHAETATESPESKALYLDIEKYEHFLEGMDEAQKREFLETLWAIIVNFVDLGFGVHPMQQVLEDSELFSVDPDSQISDNNSVSKQSISKKFTEADAAAQNDSNEREVT